jgi:hypothetical protein
MFQVRAISGLRPNSSELLLAQISMQLAHPPNAMYSPLPNVLLAPPTRLEIATNVLWTISLALSLTCTLGAILVQDWMQEYLRHSQCHDTPSTRARIRAYLFNGLRGYRLDQVISAIPVLLHLAILFFGTGLITYFFAFNNIVAYAALVAYSISGTSYLLITISPLISLSSPFKTPISNVLWRAVQLIRLSVLDITQCVMSFIFSNSIFYHFRLPKIIDACRERYHGGIVRAIEQELETTSSNRDTHSLGWAISSVQSDSALESYIAAIPRFLDTDRHLYPQYTIGSLLEDRDVRLGCSIGRLLQTCVRTTSRLEPHARTCRAIACARAVWHITEKFSGLSSLYWDTLFGAETADALSTLAHDSVPSVALFARCTAFLAARSCLRELANVSKWGQTKGPHWANRARDIAGYVVKLSGIPLPVEDTETATRDGPLLILGSFLSGLPYNMAMSGADGDVSFMVNTTVKHLADGIRAGEASLDAQKQFSEIFVLDMWGGWNTYLDPATSRAVCNAAASLHQDLITRISEDGDEADARFNAGFPVPQGHTGYSIISPRRRLAPAWCPNELPKRAFSGDTTTSSTAFEPCHSPPNESSPGSPVEISKLPINGHVDSDADV